MNGAARFLFHQLDPDLQAPQQRQTNFTSTELAVAGEHQGGIETQGVEIVRILMARRDIAIMRAVTMAVAVTTKARTTHFEDGGVFDQVYVK